MLFRVSEEPGIERFGPRPSEYANERAVWAIDAEQLRNYLVPRECPRVNARCAHQCGIDVPARNDTQHAPLNIVRKPV
jgi:hypothetical protein